MSGPFNIVRQYKTKRMIENSDTGRQERLYVTTARRIAALIVTDGLQPGDRLPAEKQLARQLDVSRATIREAIVAMEVMGLIEVRINVGAVVLELDSTSSTALSYPMENQEASLKDALETSALKEVASLRILMESEGARLSIAQGGVEWESTLFAAHHRLAHIERSMHRDGDVHFDLWRQCDWDFHAALLSACGSMLHQKVHKALFDQFRKVVTLEFQTQGFRGNHIIEEHKAILDAALARDSKACADALENHISVYFRNGRAGDVLTPPSTELHHTSPLGTES